MTDEINPSTSTRAALKDATNELVAWIQRVNEVTGWTEERTFGDDVALIHSEASEALEAFREAGDPAKRWYSYTLGHVGENGLTTLKGLTPEQVEALSGQTPEELDLSPKPEGCGSELADVIVRALHTAHKHKIDIAAELDEKIAYNSTRGYRHGNKHL